MRNLSVSAEQFLSLRFSLKKPCAVGETVARIVGGQAARTRPGEADE